MALNEINEMAAILREALEDERRELGMVIKEIEYIQERMDRMIDVAIGLQHETKENSDG